MILSPQRNSLCCCRHRHLSCATPPPPPTSDAIATIGITVVYRRHRRIRSLTLASPLPPPLAAAAAVPLPPSMNCPRCSHGSRRKRLPLSFRRLTLRPPPTSHTPRILRPTAHNTPHATHRHSRHSSHRPKHAVLRSHPRLHVRARQPQARQRNLRRPSEPQSSLWSASQAQVGEADTSQVS